MACPARAGARRAGLVGRIRRPQIPGRADRVRGDALHITMQTSFVTTVDRNRQDRYRAAFATTRLGCHRPVPVPQAPGEMRVLRDDGDADHSRSEFFAGHKPEQYAEPDADSVGNDAGRVRHIRDNLCDGGDLKDRTDDAEQHRADAAPSVGDDHAPLPYRDLGHD
jgi:hypothetical protein